MKIRATLFWMLFLISFSAEAQWAVYDDEVKKVLKQINNVASIGSKTLSKYDDQAELSAKFEDVSISDPSKYVTTQEDCGDRSLNENHYLACRGLRNLRLKTLEQTEAILGKIKSRRDEILNLISESRKKGSDDAGQLQRYQFELQGIQAHLQNDAMELEALRYGYKQREKMYEVQMAEARRATDTRPPGGGAGGAAINLGTVPFVRGK